MAEPRPHQRPIMTVVIAPKNSSDSESLESVLKALAQEDPMMTVEPNEGGVLIGGMSEPHLEIICDRIAREFKIPLTIGEAKITYLETIRQPSEAEGKYTRQLGGHGQYAHVKLSLEPGEPSSGYQFIDKTSDDVVARHFVPSINSGIQEAMKRGVLAGNEIVDVRAILCGGSYHAEDSSEVAFKIAAAIAFKEAARKANPVTLEPHMALEVPLRMVAALWIFSSHTTKPFPATTSRGQRKLAFPQRGRATQHRKADLPRLTPMSHLINCVKKDFRARLNVGRKQNAEDVACCFPPRGDICWAKPI